MEDSGRRNNKGLLLLLSHFSRVRLCAQRAATAAKSLQLCPTLCDPIDGSPPASPVPGILQARTLEWVAIQCLSIFSSLLLLVFSW